MALAGHPRPCETRLYTKAYSLREGVRHHEEMLHVHSSAASETETEKSDIVDGSGRYREGDRPAQRRRGKHDQNRRFLHTSPLEWATRDRRRSKLANVWNSNSTRAKVKAGSQGTVGVCSCATTATLACSWNGGEIHVIVSRARGVTL